MSAAPSPHRGSEWTGPQASRLGSSHAPGLPACLDTAQERVPLHTLLGITKPRALAPQQAQPHLP